MSAAAIPAGRPAIAFLDPGCPGGYDLPDLAAGGVGGTEATVLRVARALRPGFDIVHYQQGRQTPQISEAGRLLPMPQDFRRIRGQVVVVLNRWKVAVKLRKVNPTVPIFLWLHVFPGRHNRKMGAALRKAGVTVICVSRTHAEALAAFTAPATPPLRHIYNPIADALQPDDTPRDRDRLLFASSPHKGLSEVFQQFSALRERLPQLTLAVADPGYLSWNTGPVPEGVCFLGPLSHEALIRQMRRALCLFYPQTSFAETFGLVLAEANAVGTPALVHGPLGANREILRGGDQLIDGHDFAQIYARITAWRARPPELRGAAAFRLSAVAQGWQELLSEAVQPRLAAE